VLFVLYIVFLLVVYEADRHLYQLLDQLIYRVRCNLRCMYRRLVVELLKKIQSEIKFKLSLVDVNKAEVEIGI
jgi:hypothetical protein